MLSLSWLEPQQSPRSNNTLGGEGVGGGREGRGEREPVQTALYQLPAAQSRPTRGLLESLSQRAAAPRTTPRELRGHLGEETISIKKKKKDQSTEIKMSFSF